MRHCWFKNAWWVISNIILQKGSDLISVQREGEAGCRGKVLRGQLGRGWHCTLVQCVQYRCTVSIEDSWATMGLCWYPGQHSWETLKMRKSPSLNIHLDSRRWDVKRVKWSEKESKNVLIDINKGRITLVHLFLEIWLNANMNHAEEVSEKMILKRDNFTFWIRRVMRLGEHHDKAED